VYERRLRGGIGHIKGAYKCVCFTEAPEHSFHEVMGRYRPFGIQLSKSWVFDRGGRPVIYQTDAEYEQLIEEQRWRHVRYEPSATPPTDFTWEREWRVRTDVLPLTPGDAIVIVPNEDWAQQLRDEHYALEEHHIELMQLSYGDDWNPGGPPEPFPYGLATLGMHQ
jgi:hypothetical protein